VILSRIIEHVKAQNWTAIVLDFVIVVCGVFIGIQLGNWNDALRRDRSAAQFQERLVADMNLESTNYEYLREYYSAVQSAAETTLAALTGEITLSDSELVVNAFRASQYNWMERQRGTYDELVASGNLDLISDTKLRTLVASYYAMTMLEEVSEKSQNSEYRRAFRMTVPPDLHQALNQQCGDRQVEGALPGVMTLDYACELEWPEDKIAATAAHLRSDDKFPALLRLQIADVSSRNATMDNNYEAYRLADFKDREASQ